MFGSRKVQRKGKKEKKCVKKNNFLMFNLPWKLRKKIKYY